VFLRSLEIRDHLKATNDFKENPIDTSLLPVLPFRISSDIRLLIVGQDPTVKNEKSRGLIEYTLNLDKKGSLRNYVSEIADKLGLRFENIYATNLFKYFYSHPPERTMHVLHNHLEPNPNFLKDEISAYPTATILTFGLPVLRLLSRPDAEAHEHWDYDKKTKRSSGGFTGCIAAENKLERDFFPLPHQPSLRKEFYNKTLDRYLEFVRNTMTN